MSFRPSENEEKYFAQLELERRRVAEERRRGGTPDGDESEAANSVGEPAGGVDRGGNRS